MKKHLLPVLVCLLSCLLSACGGGAEFDASQLEREYTREYAGTELNVFNWGEYISDGSEGTLDVNALFQELTGIKVNYTTYENNEAMYAKLKSGAVSYDVIVPSDYMIQRLAGEGLLQPVDMSRLQNYHYIPEEYRAQYFDPEDQYSVPYQVGMTGLIYNTTMVQGTPDSWAVMWDPQYADNILTFNNSRDAFSIAQLLLGQDVNTQDPADWDAAAEKLKEQNDVFQARVMDEVFNKMEAGNAAIASYYTGDYLIMVEENPDLAFVYPKEGTVYFVDSFCVPANANNYDAALLYIDFMLETVIATANSEYTVYACPHTGVQANQDYAYYQNELLYPDPADMPPVQFFHDLPADVRAYYESLWEDVLRDSQ